MVKQNYAKLMEEELKRAKLIEQERGTKPDLVLHVCCAPCSSHVLDILVDYFSVTVFYYNPNIHPRKEYERRLAELEHFLSAFPRTQEVSLVKTDYVVEDYFQATRAREERDLQTEREMGERCGRCYRFRMERTFSFAAERGADYVTTALSISPYKDAQKINLIGKELEAAFGRPRFLYADFKKNEGFKKSLEISDEYGLYRQHYCGCVYSMRRLGCTGEACAQPEIKSDGSLNTESSCQKA